MIKCRMFETPPNWVAQPNPGAPTWVHDVNLPPMILNNKNVGGPPMTVVQEIKTVYDIYVSRIGVNHPGLPAFKSDLAVCLLNIGGQGAQTTPGNPTSFIIDNPASHLSNVIWAAGSAPALHHPEHHIWFGEGILNARDWMDGAGSEVGFLTRVEDAVAAGQLPALPTRIILDTELPMHPILPIDASILDKANQTRRFQAALADVRAIGGGTVVNPDFVIPFRSPTGFTLQEWFSEADADFVTPEPLFYDANDGPWNLTPTGYDLDINLPMGAHKNRQYESVMHRLWYMQVDGGLDYSVRQPIRARSAWASTLTSNFGFAQTDDISAADPLNRSTRPIQSDEARIDSPAFFYDWHFKRITSNSTLPAHEVATRTNFIGFPDARAGGSAHLCNYVSSAIRTFHTSNACSLDLQAPHLYSAEPHSGVHAGHRQKNLYRPPASGPLVRYGSISGNCTTMAACTAPDETDEEMLIRLYRYRLRSVHHSTRGKHNPAMVTPWYVMPGLDPDPFPTTGCNPPNGTGPMPPVTLDGFRRAMMLSRAFGHREVNIFGDRTGCGECAPNCASGDYQSWLDLQTVYYQALDPFLYAFHVDRGSLAEPAMDGDTAALRRVLPFADGAPHEIGVVGAFVAPSSVRQASIEIKFAGLPVHSMPTIGSLRVVLESRVQGEVNVTGRLFARNRSGALVPLLIGDFPSGHDDSGSFGYWAQDRSLVRVFDFYPVDLHDIIDEHGILRLRIVQEAPATNPTENAYTAFHDLVQVAAMGIELSGPAEAIVGGPGEPSYADQDYSGSTDSGDLELFLEEFALSLGSADHTDDGVVSIDDLIHYAEAWSREAQ
ncbi:MAG: hypothetical protein JNK25_09355 [Phycisphaerae bacterium]|nr:hypothetical protein [Phycisphaerae bacterium]